MLNHVSLFEEKDYYRIITNTKKCPIYKMALQLMLQ